MIAVLVVRDGQLPLGADEAVAEAGGRVVVVGTNVPTAVAARAAWTWEAGPFAPGSYAAALAPWLTDEDVVLLPGSPDGRDLAPRLALALGRPLHAPALAVSAQRVTVVRGGGLRTETLAPPGPFVATLQPGCRGAEPAGEVVPKPLQLSGQAPDAASARLLPADPATVDLAEATRIVAAGAGVGSAHDAETLAACATALGASYGATRVVTDLGWAPTERQIGTTGVVVSPRVYLAVGISGAVQHVSGIGAPETVVAVNTDASCPMMAMADLAVVTDAAGFTRALAAQLGLPVPEPAAHEPLHGEAFEPA